MACKFGVGMMVALSVVLIVMTMANGPAQSFQDSRQVSLDSSLVDARLVDAQWASQGRFLPNRFFPKRRLARKVEFIPFPEREEQKKSTPPGKGKVEAKVQKPLFPASEPPIPLGLIPVFWPEDNPYSQAKAELGWLLFFDTRLSSDGTISCASCHDPKFGFSDGQPASTGIGGQKGGRNAPSVINHAYGLLQFWDGRAANLEDQAKGPIANPIEMTVEKTASKAHETCVQRLRKVAGYRQRFQDVFGTEDFTIDHVAQAIATFERTILSGNSPFDRFKAGDKKALTPGQQRGMEIFFSNKARCDSCHEGVAFTTNRFTNIGIGMDKPKPDLGRYNVTKKEEDKGAFKTPGLRDVALTAPYMHDGSLKTLEEVVEHYNKGGIANPWLHQDVRKLDLNDQEKKDLVDFLKALTGQGWQHIKAPTALPQ